jgi:parallel beta-helix repeat protein
MALTSGLVMYTHVQPTSHQEHSLRVWAPVCLLALVSLMFVGWHGIVWADKLSVANNGIDSATCGSSNAPCRSISQAIAHASAGDTIEVGPGRYGDLNGNRILGEVGEENAALGGGCDLCMININKRLTLVSTDGAAVTVIDAGGIEIRAVLIVADGVVFGGRGQGFTIANAGSIGLVVDNGTSDVTVVGNIAMHNGLFLNHGISIGGSGHTIRENIALGNIVAGFAIGGSGHTVSDNVASGNRIGFEAFFSGQFTHNVASGNADGGGIIVNNAGIIEIFRNAVIGNEGTGIQVSNRDATITENNIFGNGTLGNNCGLLSLSGTVFMAPNNFWGAASGPGPDPADAVGAACGGNPDPTIVDPVATKPFNIPVRAGL